MKRKLAWILILALAVTLISPVLPVNAVEIVDSGTCGDNLTWTLDENGTLTISGTGAMEDYYWDSAPWYSYCDSIETVVIEDGVTSIGDYAFLDCCNLTTVELPVGLLRIGVAAFKFDYALVGITIPDTVVEIEAEAFLWCCALTEINIPDGITAIADMTFQFCTELTEITIPDSVTAIGYQAFFSCTALTDILIPDSVTSIGANAFLDCSSMNEITFEGNAPTFGSKVFSFITATAYYPANNATWTEDVMQDYGGTITWVAYEVHAHNYTESERVDATCTETGYVLYICHCGDSYSETLNATGHRYGKWTQVKAPTTEETGLEERACSCGEKEQREIAMLESESTKSEESEHFDFMSGAKDTDDGGNGTIVFVFFVALCGVIMVLRAMKKKK